MVEDKEDLFAETHRKGTSYVYKCSAQSRLYRESKVNKLQTIVHNASWPCRKTVLLQHSFNLLYITQQNLYKKLRIYITQT